MHSRDVKKNLITVVELPECFVSGVHRQIHAHKDGVYHSCVPQG